MVHFSKLSCHERRIKKINLNGPSRIVECVDLDSILVLPVIIALTDVPLLKTGYCFSHHSLSTIFRAVLMSCFVASRTTLSLRLVLPLGPTFTRDSRTCGVGIRLPVVFSKCALPAKSISIFCPLVRAETRFRPISPASASPISAVVFGPPLASGHSLCAHTRAVETR